MDYRKLIKIIGGVFLSIILIFFQLSFIGNLPYPWNNFNLIFALLFFVVLLLNYQLGFWGGIITGLLFEVYSVLPFGNTIFPLIISLILINFLFNLLFTNRSLYSLILLSLLALMVYHVLRFFYANSIYALNWSTWHLPFDASYLKNIGWQIILVLIFLVLIFLSLRLFSKRFKSVFLVEGRR